MSRREGGTPGGSTRWEHRPPPPPPVAFVFVSTTLAVWFLQVAYPLGGWKASPAQWELENLCHESSRRGQDGWGRLLCSE